MKRIFVYEHLTGGGEPASRRDTALRAMGRGDTALRAMGREMRDAVAADLLALGVYDVTVADSEAEPETRRDADADTARDALADAGPDADTDGLAPADLATPDPDPA